jgi:hypothetical protein
VVGRLVVVLSPLRFSRFALLLLLFGGLFWWVGRRRRTEESQRGSATRGAIVFDVYRKQTPTSFSKKEFLWIKKKASGKKKQKCGIFSFRVLLVRSTISKFCTLDGVLRCECLSSYLFIGWKRLAKYKSSGLLLEKYAEMKACCSPYSCRFNRSNRKPSLTSQDERGDVWPHDLPHSLSLSFSRPFIIFVQAVTCVSFCEELLRALFCRFLFQLSQHTSRYDV